jgi:2-(1,2-epoxy-1,2-dihydrophenyl)acetyl-CoA isomerase
MSSSVSLLVSLENGVKRVVFNHPSRRNAIDASTAEWLRDVMLESAEDDTRVLVLSGRGESFCSGFDVFDETSADVIRRDVPGWLRSVTNRTILAMREMPKPIVARVHGPAMGFGCSLALASDVVLASEGSTFGLTFARLGLMPDGGSTFFLPRLIGHQRAFELMVSGEALSAESARALGIVNRVLPAAALDGIVDAVVQRLLCGSREAIASIKGALHAQFRAPLEAALEYEADHQGKCAASPDFAEGVRAFAEKRTPMFGVKAVEG